MPHIGEFATSMEMAGLSVSIMKLDEQLKELMADPANTPFYTNHNKKRGIFDYEYYDTYFCF